MFYITVRSHVFEIKKKYGHFRVKVTKILPIPFIVPISKLHTPRSNFDNEFNRTLWTCSINEGKGRHILQNDGRKKYAWVWSAAKHLCTHNHKHTITSQHA